MVCSKNYNCCLVTNVHVRYKQENWLQILHLDMLNDSIMNKKYVSEFDRKNIIVQRQSQNISETIHLQLTSHWVA